VSGKCGEVVTVREATLERLWREMMPTPLGKELRKLRVDKELRLYDMAKAIGGVNNGIFVGSRDGEEIGPGRSYRPDCGEDRDTAGARGRAKEGGRCEPP